MKPSLPILLILLTASSVYAQSPNAIIDENGAVIRGDINKKQIALVLTGDSFADGGVVIRKTLRKCDVHASFFLTGNFYSNQDFHSLLVRLKIDGHYLGGHSDKHLLYADWTKRDSTLITENEFKADLRENYVRMREMGITKTTSSFFLPPYEWYNRDIAHWTADLGLTLVNFTPGTLSTSDYTYPEMEGRYRSSSEIYESIINAESKDPNGLNGYILLIHIGTDPRRTDKFYNLLEELLVELKGKGYAFIRIDKLLK